MTSVSRRARHWVIGDVHGCSGSLDQLLAQLPQGDRLIFCGDAINRGPDTPATMERIWSLVDSGRAIWLRGNHEQDLIDALRTAPSSSRGAGAETCHQLGPEGCALWLKRLEQLPLAYWGKAGSPPTPALTPAPGSRTCGCAWASGSSTTVALVMW